MTPSSNLSEARQYWCHTWPEAKRRSQARLGNGRKMRSPRPRWVASRPSDSRCLNNIEGGPGGWAQRSESDMAVLGLFFAGIGGGCACGREGSRDGEGELRWGPNYPPLRPATSRSMLAIEVRRERGGRAIDTIKYRKPMVREGQHFLPQTSLGMGENTLRRPNSISTHGASQPGPPTPSSSQSP